MRSRRRTFVGASLAAGAGLVGGKLGGHFEFVGASQQDVTGIPEEILNPVEVTGDEAVPIVGRLPGARRMYMLPAEQGEFRLIGSQVIKRISRAEETGGVAGVHEVTSFSGRIGAATAPSTSR